MSRSLAALGLLWSAGIRPAAAAEPVRANAVVSVSFDEPAPKTAAVAVAGAAQPFTAALVNGAAKVESPFWNQTGKRAVKLDADKRQYIRLTDVPYLDRPDALSVSLYYLSLHANGDTAARGIFAKRSRDGRGTNYAVNYVPASDTFQVYVNDGRGFRIASYSARAIVGSRRLVHLTATFEVGDAPAPDADTDRDDVLVRLYVNGEPAAAKSAVGGDINGSDVWFTNLNIAGLLNDVPLTLGASTPASEFASCVIDEFLLFARALSPAEARQLFLETAGPHGAELARRQEEVKSLDPIPTVDSISQFGIQKGRTTRLAIGGRGLAGNPRVDLPISGLEQSVDKSSTAQRLVVDLTVPAGTPPGIYPISVWTAGGISRPLAIAVDGLPQYLVGDSAPDRPSALPAAFSGRISGAAQSRVYFDGRKGARLVAEVEARRIGSAFEPVLELKNAAGRTLAIEWGKAYLRGDARAEVVLPEDGRYILELHDLEYKAPGDSPFRLLVGDFWSVDQYFPPVVERGSTVSIEPVGTGIPPGMLIAADWKADPGATTRFMPVPRGLDAAAPFPPLRISDDVELLQVPQPGKQLQTIDARFADKRQAAVAMNGRLLKPDQVDRYVLAVTPGRPLLLSVEGRSLNSPVEGEISIYSQPDGKLLATDGGTPGAASRGFQYQVPADVSAIQVGVRDLMNRGGKEFVYRLRIAPAGQPNVKLSLEEARLNIPRDGRTVAKLRVERLGYAGPINLRVEGDERIAIEPTQIPAEGTSREVLVTFASRKEGSRKGAAAVPLGRVRVVGEFSGLNPPVRRVAQVDIPNPAALVGFLDQVPVAVRGESPAQIDISSPPTYVLKGVDAVWPVKVAVPAGMPGEWLRLSLVSTERPRPVNNEGRRRRRRSTLQIVAAADQSISTAAGAGNVKVIVPPNIADPAIDFVIKADVVVHPYSERVLATTYSRPFRVLVQDPVALQVDARSLTLTAGAAGKIRGKLVRHPGFKQPVSVSVAGLPAGYQAQPATVAAEQADFEIPVTVPGNSALQAVPNVSIQVALADGKVPIKQAIEMKIAAAKK